MNRELYFKNPNKNLFSKLFSKSLKASKEVIETLNKKGLNCKIEILGANDIRFTSYEKNTHIFRLRTNVFKQKGVITANCTVVDDLERSVFKATFLYV